MTSTAPPTPSTTDAWRIEIHKRPGTKDPAGHKALVALAELGVDVARACHAGHGYLLPPDLDREEVERVARDLFTDPVLEVATVLAPGEIPAAAPGRVRGDTT